MVSICPDCYEMGYQELIGIDLLKDGKIFQLPVLAYSDVHVSFRTIGVKRNGLIREDRVCNSDVQTLPESSSDQSGMSRKHGKFLLSSLQSTRRWVWCR